MTGNPVTGTPTGAPITSLLPVTGTAEPPDPTTVPTSTPVGSGDPDLEQLEHLQQPEGEDPADEEPRDWAWVEEWREGGEPMPWGPGLAIAAFTAFLVASAVYVLSSGLSTKPLVAIGVNVVVVAGLCPALWLSRGLPVLRWIAGGAAAGVLAAWLCVLVFLA